MAKRRSGNYLLRLSIFLMIIGFGSILLSFTDYQFTLLSWANGMQPWVGLVVGAAGLAILLVPMLARRGGAGGMIAPAQHLQQQGYGYPAPQQGYGAPQQQFPQQQNGFPQQPGVQQPGMPQPGMPQPGVPQAQPGFAQQPYPGQPQPGFNQPQQGFNQPPGYGPAPQGYRPQ